jgi:predicted DsbA family dithiol-disulfide isomerase
MSNRVQLDVVSDVVCPWCIIGYKNLQTAIEELGVADKIELQWQPFELNPSMPPEGQDLREHVAEKYGSSLEESNQSRINITARGKEAGFTFNFFDEMKIVNTRDAHILLEYAHELGKQTELKLRLFTAVFTDQKDVSNRDVLLDEILAIGLDKEEAIKRLESEAQRQAIVAQEQEWQRLGISSVPTVVFNRTSAMSGAHPVSAYKEALTELLSLK